MIPPFLAIVLTACLSFSNILDRQTDLPRRENFRIHKHSLLFTSMATRELPVSKGEWETRMFSRKESRKVLIASGIRNTCAAVSEWLMILDNFPSARCPPPPSCWSMLNRVAKRNHLSNGYKYNFSHNVSVENREEGEGYKFLGSQIPAWRITSRAREGKGNTVISY